MNLMLAVLWLVVASGLFLWPWLVPNARMPTIGDTGIPVGWLALLLALYNVARWATTRNDRRQRALAEERRRAGARAHARWPGETDPTFDFTEGQPPRKPEPPGPST
jgi:hypothetical protein